MIKAVVLDVDGTLTEKSRKIIPEVLDALPKVQGSGVMISLVSGNVIPVMYALKTYLGINGPVFGENGGIMLLNNEVQPFFSIEEPKRFFEYMRKRISINEILTNRWRETSVAFEGSRDEITGELSTLDSNWSGRIGVVDSTYAWHIMNRGQSKAFAVKKIMELYSLGGESVLVCGDSDNDFAMYEVPAVKAAVSNSTDSIKKASEYVSEKSHGMGVIDIFRHYGLL